MSEEAVAERPPRLTPLYVFPVKSDLPPGWDMHRVTYNVAVYQKDKSGMRVIVDYIHQPVPLLHVSVAFMSCRSILADDLEYVARHFMIPNLPVAHILILGDAEHLYQLPDPHFPMIQFPVKHSIEFADASRNGK